MNQKIKSLIEELETEELWRDENKEGMREKMRQIQAELLKEEEIKQSETKWDKFKRGVITSGKDKKLIKQQVSLAIGGSLVLGAVDYMVNGNVVGAIRNGVDGGVKSAAVGYAVGVSAGGVATALFD